MILRLRFYAKRNFKPKDKVIFWVASAKLSRKVESRVERLLDMLPKETK